MLNKRHPPELQLMHLAAGLQGMLIDEVFLKPAVRAALEGAWSHEAVFETEGADGET